VSSVLVARFERRSEVAPVVRAALDVDIVYVALPAPPPAGRQTLQLFVGDELVAAVSAELVGSGRGGEYPLRMRLIDPAHAPELAQLAERRSRPPDPLERHEPHAALPRAGPRPSRTSMEAVQAGHASVAWAPPSGAAVEEPTLVSASTVSASPESAEALPASVEEPTLSSRLDAPRPPALEAPSRAHVALLQAAPPSAEPSRSRRAQALFDEHDDPTLQREVGQPRADYFTDDESQTLPGQSSRKPGAFGVSWNVRITPTTKDPMCGRTIDGGKYVLDSVIGTGAIGIVFKASHRDLGRTVAVKVLNPRYRDDLDVLNVFRTEARAASQLEHPNVARVYDYGQEPDGLVYIVMEYLSGYTLGSVLEARRKLTPARAADVMIQVCAALSAAHDRGIVHRDVKPDNIVLVPAQDDEGQPVENVKVCDFGIAALGMTKTEEGVVLGTPEYMAPEQTVGAAISPAADVYACGVVLYEMLVGDVPFTADQAYRILMKHRDEAPRPPSLLSPDVSPALEAVILRCLEKSPERRFTAARDLRVALRKLASTLGPATG
jgi:serine/threonine-protein kinase